MEQEQEELPAVQERVRARVVLELDLAQLAVLEVLPREQAERLALELAQAVERAVERAVQGLELKQVRALPPIRAVPLLRSGMPIIGALPGPARTIRKKPGPSGVPT